jgi:heterotetrameric sarcosine oxidase delta subunit
MGFLIPCPNCGRRDVYEFKFGLEVKQAPREGADLRDWRHYLYFHQNRSGLQEEWWYHAYGCGAWFKIRRNTTTNEILSNEPETNKE